MSSAQPSQPKELEGQLQTIEEIPMEQTNAFVEEKLQKSLKSVYNSTRVANEIAGFEIKLHSLMAIRQSLCNDSNRPQAGLQSMDNTINELEASIESKRAEMKTAEQQVVQGFQEIAQHLLDVSENKAHSTSKGFLSALERFGSILKTQCNQRMDDLDRAIAELKTTKMDATEKQGIKNTLEDMKANIIAVQSKSLTSMAQMSTEHLKKIDQRVERALAQVNPDVITNQVEQKILRNLDNKFKGYLDQAKQQNALMVDEQKNASDKVAELVKNEVMNQVGPAHLQSIITSLPEFQALKQMRDALPSTTNTTPDFDSVKSVIMNLTSELMELKQRTSSTRAIVDTLRTQGLPTSESDAIEFDQTASLKHMEEMEKDVAMIHNSIKMIEAVISVKSKAVEEATTVAESSTRKRPRWEDVSNGVPEGEVGNSVILAKLNDIETKHQKLIDFIFQCKDTVLDDMFPTRLEAAIKKIERILLNHETFISYIIDPFSTSKRTISIPAESSSTAPANNDFSALNPAMLDAISQLVKQTAEEISLPLQKRIKHLEEKLEANQL